MEDRFLRKEEVAGSNPAGSTELDHDAISEMDQKFVVISSCTKKN